jgi:hypothetical protein
MKKQILILCLVLLLLGALPVRAADDHSYTFSDFGITLTMPDMGAVFTRDLPADDPTWERYGITKESFLPLMEDMNVYLSAPSPDFNLEITVSIEESLSSSYDTLSEQELEENIRDWITYGLVDDGEVYSHPQVLFEKTTSTLTDGGNMLNYITAFNGYYYTITLFCRDGQITAEREAMMDALVDSIVFDTTAPLSSAFEDTDEATGAAFLMPYLAIALVVILLLIVLWVILRRRKKAARGISADAVSAAPLEGPDSTRQSTGSTQDLPQSGVELLEQLRDEMEAAPAAPSSGTASGTQSDPAAAAPPSNTESSEPPQEEPRDPA